MRQIKTKPTNIILCGASGRMGQAIIQSAPSCNVDIIGASFNKSNPSDVPHLDESNVTNADVIIDFSAPNHTIEMLNFATDHAIPFVSGVTGLSADQVSQMQKAAKKIPVFYAPKMSRSFFIFLQNAVDIASRLPDEYDIEILDIHHKYKKDAPSAAAFLLLDALKKVREIGPMLAERFTKSAAKRQNDIGIASIRSGSDMVSEHRVIFANHNERVEIMHRSATQGGYAIEALQAAKWLMMQQPGYYQMDNFISAKATT